MLFSPESISVSLKGVFGNIHPDFCFVWGKIGCDKKYFVRCVAKKGKLPIRSEVRIVLIGIAEVVEVSLND